MSERIVALGASNLTRGLQTIVAESRAAWGPSVEILAALGHGRSYGARSSFVGRTLPGILDCGLWRHLEGAAAAPTRALVTDVGNDILYGFPGQQVLAWTAEAVDRLQRVTQDIVLTDLPMVSIRRLSNAKFLAVRSVIFPQCHLTLARVMEAAEQVNEGLAALAAGRGVRLQRLRASWYGFDPIHMRPSKWRQAWAEILRARGPGGSPAAGSWREWLLLYALRPEREWLFGRERLRPQHGRRLRAGGRVWLY